MAKCPDCPVCLPGWLATFADMITLLLCFFVLLLAMSKKDAAKTEAALGSIRNSFGGNVLNMGEVMQLGKSPEDAATLIEAQEAAKPFPIEFLTVAGLLPKHEINRESTEDLSEMKSDLGNFELQSNAEIFELNEGLKIVMKDGILFEKGSMAIKEMSIPIFENLVKLMTSKKYQLYVQGHSSLGEESSDGRLDAYELSSQRAMAVTKTLIKKGVPASSLTPIFYGDTRLVSKEDESQNRRVEFIIRKVSLDQEGQKVGGE
jgi:chemotaxis protein MotB